MVRSKPPKHIVLEPKANFRIKDPRRGWTSASSAEADSLCPGRYRAQLGLPEVPNPTAQFGIDIHDAFAGADSVDLSISQERILEMAEEICADAEQRVFGLGTSKVLREKRLWTTIGTDYQHSGQCDRIYFQKDHALIADLKSLRGEVALAPENMQLRDEATLVFLNYPKIKRVSVFICQPLVTRVPVICLYEREKHFIKMYDALCTRVYNSHDPAGQRVPGTVQCLHCRARATCAPAIKWAKTMPLQRAPTLAASVERLTPRQLADIWEKSGTIKSILNEVNRRLTTLTELQLQALGLRMRPGHTRRSVNNPNALFARLKPLGVTVDEFTRIAKVPIGAVSDLVRRKTGYISHRLDKQVAELVDGLTDDKQTKPSLEKI